MQAASGTRSSTVSADGAMLHAQRGTHKGDPKSARHLPRERCSSSEGEHDKVNQAAAAIHGTEANHWKKAGGKSGHQASCHRLWLSVEYLTYTLDALMPVTPCMVSNMSKRAFDACCRCGKAFIYIGRRTTVTPCSQHFIHF